MNKKQIAYFSTLLTIIFIAGIFNFYIIYEIDYFAERKIEEKLEISMPENIILVRSDYNTMMMLNFGTILSKYKINEKDLGRIKEYFQNKFQVNIKIGDNLMYHKNRFKWFDFKEEDVLYHYIVVNKEVTLGLEFNYIYIIKNEDGYFIYFYVN